MAKTEAAAGTEKKAEGGKKAPRKTFKKRGEKRVVHHGYVHIHASFNNTHITITDTDRVVERRRDRLQGLAQGDAVCGHPGGHECRQRRQDTRAALGGRQGQGPGVGPRVGDSRAADGGYRGEVDPRRHADSAQWLPPDEAPPRLSFREDY
jgi:hypothetical protein